MTSAAPEPAGGIVCEPSAIPAAERATHLELGRLLFIELAELRIDSPDGIALRLPAGELPRVARFTANERKCCPFLHIRIELAPAGSAMWLHLTGPQGTRELIDAELDLKPMGSCKCG